MVNSCNKGKAFERDIASIFRQIFPGARRGLQFQEGTGAEPDVVIPYFWIECKVGAAPPVWRALAQAEKFCGNELIPLAVCKRDRHGPTVTLNLHHFLDILKKARGDYRRCYGCGGDGKTAQAEPQTCQECAGTGWVEKARGE